MNINGCSSALPSSPTTQIEAASPESTAGASQTTFGGVSIARADANSPEALITKAIKEASQQATELRFQATTVAANTRARVKTLEGDWKTVPFWKRSLHASFSNAIDAATFQSFGADARARKAEQKLTILRSIATLPPEYQEKYLTTFETLNSEAEEKRGAARKLEDHWTTPFPSNYKKPRPSDKEVDNARFTALEAESKLDQFTNALFNREAKKLSSFTVVDRSEASSPQRSPTVTTAERVAVKKAVENAKIKRPFFSFWLMGSKDPETIADLSRMFSNLKAHASKLESQIEQNKKRVGVQGK